MGTEVESFAPPVHRAIAVADVANFAQLTEPIQRVVRNGLVSALREAYTAAGIDWTLCTAKDHGDGAMILAPPAVPASRLASLAERLAVGLRRYAAANSACPIRVRVALHAGMVHPKGPGQAIYYAFRIIDSSEVRSAALRFPSGSVMLIASGVFYQEVIAQDPAADPDSYHPILVRISHQVDRVRIPAVETVWVRTLGDRERGADRVADLAGQPGVRDFDTFYLETYRLVRNIVHARAQDWALAEDVANEALAIAYRKWDDLLEHPNPAGFVVVTARRILSKIQRQRASTAPPLLAPLDPNQIPDPRNAAVDPADAAVKRTAILRALRVLPPDQRECFVLHHILDHPIRMIAELLHIPEGTVKTRLRAARLALRDLLDDTSGGRNR
jgi:RNA polymerase sigma factor (sigma-70 family)